MIKSGNDGDRNNTNKVRHTESLLCPGTCQPCFRGHIGSTQSSQQPSVVRTMFVPISQKRKLTDREVTQLAQDHTIHSRGPAWNLHSLIPWQDLLMATSPCLLMHTEQEASCQAFRNSSINVLLCLLNALWRIIIAPDNH